MQVSKTKLYQLVRRLLRSLFARKPVCTGGEPVGFGGKAGENRVKQGGEESEIYTWCCRERSSN